MRSAAALVPMGLCTGRDVIGAMGWRCCCCRHGAGSAMRGAGVAACAEVGYVADRDCHCGRPRGRPHGGWRSGAGGGSCSLENVEVRGNEAARSDP